MARDITSAIQTASESGSGYSMVLMADLDFPSGHVRLHTGAGKIVFGGNTYQGIGRLGGISPVEDTAELKASRVDFIVSGIPTEYISTALNEDYRHRDAKLYVAFLDNGGQNLLTYSEQFDNAVWTKAGGATITKDTQTAPDGSITADEAIYDGTSNGRVDQTYTSPEASTDYTLSMYVKLLSGTPSADFIVSLRIFGDVVSTAVNKIGSDINGTWQRFSIKVTTNSSPSSITAQIRCDEAITLAIWGAQLGKTDIVEDYSKTEAAIRQGRSTLITDPMLAFWGRMDTMPITLGETATITLRAASRLEDWDRPRSDRYTNESQQEKFPGDRGLEYVSQTTDRKLIWGRT